MTLQINLLIPCVGPHKIGTTVLKDASIHRWYFILFDVRLFTYCLFIPPNSIPFPIVQMWFTGLMPLVTKQQAEATDSPWWTERTRAHALLGDSQWRPSLPVQRREGRGEQTAAWQVGPSPVDPCSTPPCSLHGNHTWVGDQNTDTMKSPGTLYERCTDTCMFVLS